MHYILFIVISFFLTSSLLTAQNVIEKKFIPDAKVHRILSIFGQTEKSIKDTTQSLSGFLAKISVTNAKKVLKIVWSLHNSIFKIQTEAEKILQKTDLGDSNYTFQDKDVVLLLKELVNEKILNMQNQYALFEELLIKKISYHEKHKGFGSFVPYFNWENKNKLNKALESIKYELEKIITCMQDTIKLNYSYASYNR